MLVARLGPADRTAQMISKHGNNDVFGVEYPLQAKTTADISNPELYNAYFQNAYEDWTSNQIVGSLAHGLVAAPAFSNGFNNIIATFQGDRDANNAAVTAATLALQTLR